MIERTIPRVSSTSSHWPLLLDCLDLAHDRRVRSHPPVIGYDCPLGATPALLSRTESVSCMKLTLGEAFLKGRDRYLILSISLL